MNDASKDEVVPMDEEDDSDDVVVAKQGEEEDGDAVVGGKGEEEDSDDKDSDDEDSDEEEEEEEELEDTAVVAQRFKEEGNSKYKAGDLYGAIDAYTSAIDNDPTIAAYYNNRAAARMGLENPQTKKAISDCKKAVELDPKNVKALVRLGKSSIRLGLMEEAISAFKQALEISSTNGVARAELQEAKKTAQRLKRARELMAEGKTNEAQSMINAGLVRSPESYEFNAMRAEVLVLNGHYQLALKLSNQLLRDNHNDINLLYTRAKVKRTLHHHFPSSSS